MRDPSSIDEIVALYETRGARLYGGEAVTQAAHALQCAHMAELSGAVPALVAAAFLHDIAHLLEDDTEAAASRGEDLKHEVVGAQAIAPLFPPEVTECVRLHVDAKRYLVATDDGYAARLSPASQLSLTLQGGPLDTEEVAAFAANPHAEAALALRRWDEGAKDPAAETPGLAHFRAYLEAAARR
ncbi:MAG: phosphonate degradation HD-domain oxygenase [Alphaproteobacteria bacterium]